MKKKIEALDLQSKITLQSYSIKTVCDTNRQVDTLAMEQVTKPR